MTRVLLVRHAQSEWNASSRWQGWADPPLTALGRTQAAHAGEWLSRSSDPLERAVASDLDRARSTAQILASFAGSEALRTRRPPVEEVPGLRELDVGRWSGHTRAEIAAAWPDELARWDAGLLDTAPGGESLDAFDHRVRSALTQVLAADSVGQLLVVAHGGVVRSVGRWLGAPEITGHHVAGLWLEYDGGRLAITGTVDLLADATVAPAARRGEGGADATEAVPDDSADAR